MADFVALAATAERLIEANGRSVTVTKQGATAADPNKPWRTTPTPVAGSVTGLAVFVAPSSLGYVVENVDNVKRAEQVALFAANNDGGSTLEDFDVIIDGGTTWKILRAEVLQPASTRLLYMFEVSR